MVIGSVLAVRCGHRYENLFGIPVPIIPCCNLVAIPDVVTLTLIFVAASFQLLANLKGNSATQPRVIGIGNGFDLRKYIYLVLN